MTNTAQEWRSRGATSIHATIYARACGWHVLVHQTGATMQSVLNPRLIGKSCVPYKVGEGDPTAADQVQALAVGLFNVASGAPEECANL